MAVSNLEKANSFLADLDAKLGNLIIEIEKEKDIRDSRAGKSSIADSKTVTDYIDTINAIKIEDSEEILVAINSRYDNVLKVLKEAINDGDENYKEQMENELKRLEENKSLRYDPIKETYKELVERMEKGEIQKDYYQAKADEKEAELKVKQKYYDKKSGNINLILANIKGEPLDKLKEKTEYQTLYEKMKELNKTIDGNEALLKDPAVSDEEKEEIKEKTDKLKKEREEKVKKFVDEATDKDGKKYEKKEEKSDKEYIDELDESKIKEAVEDSLNKIKDKIKAMDPEERTYTSLDNQFKEVGTLDVSTNLKHIKSIKGVEAYVKELEKQKLLWQQKAKDEGFDKTKLEQERSQYQEKASWYHKSAETKTSSQNLPITLKDTYKDRYRANRTNCGVIKSFFKAAFGKRKPKSEQNYDMEMSKKEALKYLSNHSGELSKIRAQDRNKPEFKKSLEFNITMTEAELKAFWDREEKKAEKIKSDEEAEK